MFITIYLPSVHFIGVFQINRNSNDITNDIPKNSNERNLIIKTIYRQTK